ncbi:MAG: pyridoxamine 5'-phosphate oxidase family protein [Thermodesulfobacteriota bacterium]
MLNEIKALVKKKDMCVLATVSGGNPHCSLMAYATDEECREIYMVTEKGTKKYQNLAANPSVSLLIDTREELTASRPVQARALTVDGLYQKIDDEDKKRLARARFLERHPHLAGFIDQNDTELLRITVTSFLLLTGLKEAHFERMS